MFRWGNTLLACVALACAAGAAAQVRYPGVGRPATTAEIRAWDIDVRPDFQGLPAGSGSVSKGRDIWDAKCASCHGTFGESNEVFTPIVGGTTKEDLKSGRVKALLDPETPRTTLMKLATLSTLWDYINRAMPWTAPKTLSTEEVYAVTAYILNLGDIVPDDFVLSDRNIAEVQKLLPNRNGLTREHGLWDIRAKPDVKNIACMRDCTAEVRITSQLPQQARTAHGNLAAQNRTFGPVRGIETIATNVAAPVRIPAQSDPKAIATSSGCLACHGVSTKSVGPAFTDIAQRYGNDAAVHAKLVAKVKTGGAGAWGAVPMPPQPQLDEDQLRTMVGWILSGAK